MAKVQIDVSADMLIGEFFDMCEEYGVEFKVIESRGPGGGNPLIEFTGTDEDVKRFISDNYYNEEDDY